MAAHGAAMLKEYLDRADVNAMYAPDMDAGRASPLLCMPQLVAALV